MKNTKFTFLQQKVQQQRRSAASATFEHTEFKMTPQRKEFLDMLEKLKQDTRGDEK
tara:strand:- start:1573 stop:1740 length:168 start_codon:yes stop_codon:yes gene_type:complete